MREETIVSHQMKVELPSGRVGDLPIQQNTTGITNVLGEDDYIKNLTFDFKVIYSFILNIKKN